MRTPLYNALKRYAAEGGARLHMPGHKAASTFLRAFPGAELDITELGFSDDVHAPAGVIARAQQLAAQQLGCDSVIFGTAGSTTLIHIMVYAASKLGKKLLIQRNSHRSVYSACRLFGVNPVIIGEDALTAQELTQTLRRGPDIGAVLLTYPDYYGNTLDIAEAAQAVKAEGRLMLCDGAHSAHFCYCELLPAAAQHHCDMTALSGHKTLPALTPGTYLCTNGGRAGELARQAFLLLHTSSPSYPIMASLDWAREYMRKNGHKKLQELHDFTRKLKERLRGSSVIIADNADFTRLCVDISALSLTQARVDNVLKSCGVTAEICTPEMLVFILTAADSKSNLSAAARVLQRLADMPKGRKRSVAVPQTPPVRVMEYLEAAEADSVLCPLEQSAGRVLAKDIGFYPPGTPTVAAGELMDESWLSYLIPARKRLFGLENGCVYVIQNSQQIKNSD